MVSASSVVWMAAAVLATAVVLGAPLALLSLARGLLARRRHDDDDEVLRRCDRCGRGWKASPRVELSLPGVLARQLVRRVTRARKWRTPAWARAQGWRRCPSCLSRRVRTSGDLTTDAPEPRQVLELLARGVVALGVLVVLTAVLSPKILS